MKKDTRTTAEQCAELGFGLETFRNRANPHFEYTKVRVQYTQALDVSTHVEHIMSLKDKFQINEYAWSLSPCEREAIWHRLVMIECELVLVNKKVSDSFYMIHLGFVEPLSACCGEKIGPRESVYEGVVIDGK